MMRRLLLLVLLTAALPVASAPAQDNVTICHSTGNPQPPYVELTLNNAGVLEHVNHEDDLVPAPAGGCPATAVVDPADTPAPTGTPDYAESTPTATPAPSPTRTPRPQRDGEDDQAGEDDGAGVQGGGGSGGAPTPTSSPRGPQPDSADVRHLPMTGAEMWLIGAFGIGFLLSGTGLRLLSPAAGRPPGPSGR